MDMPRISRWSNPVMANPFIRFFRRFSWMKSSVCCIHAPSPSINDAMPDLADYGTPLGMWNFETRTPRVETALGGLAGADGLRARKPEMEFGLRQWRSLSTSTDNPAAFWGNNLASRRHEPLHLPCGGILKSVHLKNHSSLTDSSNLANKT